ncbi:ABC1-domain-containing protein [Vararia minispora EC-137]|uniref:ABC1-domain-containing protein n=1 Tax=Vararia minispora EC-137 TaxID=1314806 RepID=A0ACB8QYT5_9AGAM|nr:ABC1-domain-containing protein [Vararia minispora EC-137]
MIFSGLQVRQLWLANTSRAFATARSHTYLHPPRPSRLVKYVRRSAYVGATIGTAYLADRELFASTVTRNLRTLYTCAIIALDYKLNFTPEKSDEIQNLHARVAKRLLHLFTSNGGLYIKFGQAIGANAALLPKPMQEQFSRLFDDAPQLSYNAIARVLSAEFGGRPVDGPGGLFANFERTAVASASIAQVHRARTHDGHDVAVKIQKPAVAQQMEPDLAVFALVMRAYEWFFELPAYFVVDYISDHLRQELDFEAEARNGQRTAALIAADKALAGRVHVPVVDTSLSTRRVLTTEWIDGVRMSDRESVMRLMGDISRLPEASHRDFKLKNRVPGWDGAPLRGGMRTVMRTMVELFGAQIFRWGWVHADPHPGNFLLRPHPLRPRESQLVLIDHGLYVQCSPKFMRQYAELWKGLLVGDMATVRDVATDWGIGAPDVFASATLLRPIRLGNSKRRSEKGKWPEGEEKPLSQYELSVKMKARLKSFLRDTDRMPKELVFIGRNMRMVQGNNQMFGSPVNRIKITSFAAADALPRSPSLSLSERVREYARRAVFYTVMLSIDAVFWAVKTREWISARWSRERKKVGFEDELERQMAAMMKAEYGIEVDPVMFEA